MKHSSWQLAATTLALVCLLLAGSAQGVTRIVPTYFPTIQAAEDVSAPGDTIYIRAGVYQENVLVDVNRLTITGVGCNEVAARSVIVDGVVPGGDPFTVTADDVTIKCLMIRAGNSNAIDATGNGFAVRNVRFESTSGLTVLGDRCDVSGSWFRHISGSAVNVTGNDGKIARNTFRNIDFQAILMQGDRVLIENNSVSVTAGNGVSAYGNEITIQDNNFETIYGDGIRHSGDDGRFIRNIFLTIAQTGILSQGNPTGFNQRTRIEANQFYKVAQHKAVDLLGHDAVVRANRVDTTGDACIFIDGDRGLAEDNVLTNCGTSGSNFLGGGNTAGLGVSGETPVVLRNTVEHFAGIGLRVECTGSCATSRAESNTTRFGGFDYSGFVIRSNGPGTTIANNTAEKSTDYGFDLQVSGATVTGNKALRNGVASDEFFGFNIEGSENLVSGNTSNDNRGGFLIIGSQNKLVANRAEGNAFDGFNVVGGSDNALERNTAQHNQGEGFDNGGTNTDFVSNISQKNRIDCATDGGSVDVNTGNVCRDGSSLVTTPQERD